MSSNYPAGVSDSHEYFNPPAISANAVECGADEARVLPSHAVKALLSDLKMKVANLNFIKPEFADFGVFTMIEQVEAALAPLEQEREYECPFNDEIDLEESECARWECPVCGNERETDTMPEERDPDEAWDRRGDDD